MEGYMNISGNHEDFDDLDIEGRITLDEWNCEDEENTSKEKAANDREEKRLLSIKVKLDDGGFGYVFSVKTSDHTVRWNCHLCDVLIIGQRHVETHIQSKKHQIKMALPSHPANIFKRIDNKPLVEMPTLAPGEPVPPGFEDVVKRITQIQATLDSHNSSPLIGLEYLVELTPDETGKEPTYVCMLCDKKGDPRVAMAHITSLSHRQKYIGIHFPTANKAMFNDLPRSKEGRKASTEIVNRICAKIEEKYGRLQPMVVEKEMFETKKDQIMRQIQVDRHFRETPEETFVEFVDISVLDTIAAEDADSVKGENKSDIDSKRSQGPYSPWVPVNPAEKISNKPVYHPPEIYLVYPDQAIPYTGKKYKKNKKNVNGQQDVQDEAQQASSDVPQLYSPNTQQIETPIGLPSEGAQMNLPPHFDALSEQGETSSSLNLLNRKRPRSTSPFTFKGLPSTANLSGGTKMRRELYENELKKVKANLLKEKEFYEKNPEGHPKYEEEWKKFWNFCNDKLRKEGKNPVQQKIVSEWISVWKKIISDYYETSFQKMKDNLLKTYCIVGSVEGTKKNVTENEEVKEKYQEKNTKEQSPEEAIEIVCEIPSKEGSNEKSRRAGSHEKSRRDGSCEKSRRERCEKSRSEKSRREGSHDKFKRERSLEKSKREGSQEKYRRERSREKSRSEKSRREGSHDKFKREISLEKSKREGSQEKYRRERSRSREKSRRERSLEKSRSEKSRREGSYDKSRRMRSLEKSRREGSYDKYKRKRSLEKSRREGSYDKSRRGSREKSRKEDSLDKSRREEGSESVSTSEDESLEYSTKRKVINTGIVSVLRLLTALESQLGSLGRNVNELLSSALSLEKISPTSSDALLANPDYFSLLETMKEKLRGQLLAGIVEKNMEKATRKCIHDIEEVLTKAEKSNADITPAKLIKMTADPVLRNMFPKPAETPAGQCSVPMNSLQVPTSLPLAKNVSPRVDTLDKTEIAQKIAMALITLGKKDVTQTELEELIKNYILMSQSSTISMASFISSQQQKYQQQLQQCQQQYHHLHQQEQLHQLLQQQPLQKQENEIGNLLNLLKHTTNLQNAKQEHFPAINFDISNTVSPNPISSLNQYNTVNATAADQNAVDELTDGDITNLLLNFKVLPVDERQGLIKLITRLQNSDPTRMDRLKKIMNFDNSYLAKHLNSSFAGMLSTSSSPYGKDSSVKKNEDIYHSSTQQGKGQNIKSDSLNEAKERVTNAMNRNIQSFTENKSLSSNLRATTMKIQRCLLTVNDTQPQHPGYPNSGNASNQYGHQILFKNSQTDCEQGSNRFIQTTLKPESSQHPFMSSLRRQLH